LRKELTMDVIGYSERGALSSLLYEISYSPDSQQLLGALMSRVTFPCTQRRPPITDATVLLEQSFSEFGDADAVVIYADAPCTVFIEAKVKTWSRGRWSISKEHDSFVTQLGGRVKSSNLFSQLFLRHALARELGQLDRVPNDGVDFPEVEATVPPWSLHRPRRLGSNRVVARAADSVIGHLDDIFFLAIVPDEAKSLENFYQNEMTAGRRRLPPDWNVPNLGFLTWEQVEEFCHDHGLSKTLAVLKFNEGQVY
jgi:hypothetical protein